MSVPESVSRNANEPLRNFKFKKTRQFSATRVQNSYDIHTYIRRRIQRQICFTLHNFNTNNITVSCSMYNCTASTPRADSLVKFFSIRIEPHLCRTITWFKGPSTPAIVFWLLNLKQAKYPKRSYNHFFLNSDVFTMCKMATEIEAAISSVNTGMSLALDPLALWPPDLTSG